MKLFTAVCNDARLLAPFLEHYSKIGVDEFYIASAPEYAAVLQQFVPRYRLTVSLHLDVAESVFGGTQAVSSMRELHQSASEWVVIVDLDEFLEPTSMAGQFSITRQMVGLFGRSSAAS